MPMKDKSYPTVPGLSGGHPGVQLLGLNLVIKISPKYLANQDEFQLSARPLGLLFLYSYKDVYYKKNDFHYIQELLITIVRGPCG